MSDGPEWFAAKRYGYGTGRPISWQGWVVLAGYLAIVLGLALGLRRRAPVALIAAIILPTVAFLVIRARTTRGGWRWRWGKDDDEGS